MVNPLTLGRNPPIAGGRVVGRGQQPLRHRTRPIGGGVSRGRNLPPFALGEGPDARDARDGHANE